jgi:hypothetical protein
MNRRDVALEHQEMDDRKESLAIEYGWLFVSSRCRSRDFTIDNGASLLLCRGGAALDDAIHGF